MRDGDRDVEFILCSRPTSVRHCVVCVCQSLNASPFQQVVDIFRLETYLFFIITIRVSICRNLHSVACALWTFISLWTILSVPLCRGATWRVCGIIQQEVKASESLSHSAFNPLTCPYSIVFYCIVLYSIPLHCIAVHLHCAISAIFLVRW